VVTGTSLAVVEMSVLVHDTVTDVTDKAAEWDLVISLEDEVVFVLSFSF